MKPRQITLTDELIDTFADELMQDSSLVQGEFWKRKELAKEKLIALFNEHCPPNPNHITWDEAEKAMRKGRDVRKVGWIEQCYMYGSGEDGYYMVAIEKTLHEIHYYIEQEDREALWEIVKP